MRLPKKRILAFLRSLDHVDDTVSLCVLVRDEFGLELTLDQASELYDQIGDPCEECGVIHEGNCPENDRRANAAAATLKYFAKHGGEWITGEKVMSPDMIEQNMSDLLCNFAHLLDKHGLCMSEVLRRAKGHYEAETSNQGVQEFFPN